MLRDQIPKGASVEEPKLFTFKDVLEQDKMISNLLYSSYSATSWNATLLTVSGRYFGKLSVINDHIQYAGMKRFDGFGGTATGQEHRPKVIKFAISEVEFIFNRYNVFVDNSCEIFLERHKSYLFVLKSAEIRSAFYQALGKVHRTSKLEKNDFFRKLRRVGDSLYQNMPPEELCHRSKITKKWCQRRLGTFNYLFYLNILANRSFNDLSQYPVFPWVLKEFDTETIDLANPANYRDLSLPIGAHSDTRLNMLRSLYDRTAGEPDRCLYRAHYSNAPLVITFQI
jgi:hypothetical protein